MIYNNIVVEGGEIMARMGRPKVNNPKSCYVSTLIDNATLEKLNKYASENDITRAQAVRIAIDCLLDGIKK